MKPFFDKAKIFLVDDLHAKLYYNGKQALVTSMNLYQHSAEKNYEIGICFDDEANLDKIRSYLKFLRSSETIVEYMSEDRQYQEEQSLNVEAEREVSP